VYAQGGFTLLKIGDSIAHAGGWRQAQKNTTFQTNGEIHGYDGIGSAGEPPVRPLP